MSLASSGSPTSPPSTKVCLTQIGSLRSYRGMANGRSGAQGVHGRDPKILRRSRLIRVRQTRLPSRPRQEVEVSLQTVDQNRHLGLARAFRSFDLENGLQLAIGCLQVVVDE